MPFQSITSPAIGISLLKSELENADIHCDIEYLNLKFANLIEPCFYAAIAVRRFVGELLFAKKLRNGNYRDQRSVMIPKLVPGGTSWVIDLDEMQKVSSEFIDDCLLSVNWHAYQVVGFSVANQQTAPALCLARMVKQKWPEMCVAFGGTSCDGEMGEELHRQYPFIDYVFAGEADVAFPEFVRQCSEGGDTQLDGMIRRDRSGRTVHPQKWAAPVERLDSLPYPDYDDYFDQLTRFDFKGYTVKVELPLETSRGCWWGERSRCTFCGFNGLTIAYRRKSPERVLDEIQFLSNKYADRFCSFHLVDSIIDLRHSANVFSRLANDPAKPIFCYTKANLSKPHVRLLAKAGVWGIQPGIESLSTTILRLMNKGCSMLQNIQLLRWCREYEIDVVWNLLYGIPGEDPEEYDKMRVLTDYIGHLQPPSLVCKVMLHRFSPFFVDPSKYGIVNITPAPWYREIYSIPDHSLARMAYCFEFDYADKRIPDEYVEHLKKAVERWRNSFAESMFLARRNAEGLLIAKDTRPYVDSCEGRIFESPYAEIIEYCDQTRHFSAVESYLRNKNLNCTAQQLKRILANLVESCIVLKDEENYLSLPCGLAA